MTNSSLFLLLKKILFPSGLSFRLILGSFLFVVLGLAGFFFLFLTRKPATYDQQIFFLLIVLGTGVSSFLFAWCLSRNLQRSIRLLRTAAKQMEGGLYSEAISEEQIGASPVEMREFCQAFNIMAGVVNQHICLLHDFNEALAVAKQSYLELSVTDQLTGLYNRTYFETEMKRLNSRQEVPVGLLVCDINGLKIVNDALGHLAGDALIKAAAEILRACFRGEDVIARIGGDEFVVMLPGADIVAARTGEERIQSYSAIYNKAHPHLPLSLAVGSAATSELPVEMENLFRKADHAMYQDKNQGKFASRQMLAKALTRNGKRISDSYI